jgi:hypothetical protein
MKYFLSTAALSLAVGLIPASTAQAQVFVRAPFVRVQVGGGVYVRAPFVNLYLPGAPALVAPPGVMLPPLPFPQVVGSPAPQQPAPQQFVPPQPTPQSTEPPQQQAPLPAPQKDPVPNSKMPPSPMKVSQTEATTLEQFAKNFQPKAGNYDVNIVNPVNNKATNVKFTLPDGNPRRVHLRQNEIEFDYGIRHFVRIEFDNEGAMITSR